jgi:hypothetical protein
LYIIIFSIKISESINDLTTATVFQQFAYKFSVVTVAGSMTNTAINLEIKTTLKYLLVNDNDSS